MNFIYIYYAVRTTKDVSNLSNVNLDKLSTDFFKSQTVQWVNNIIFTVVITVMSLLIMYKLRIHFADFYAEYGCYLRTVFIVQVLSLLTKTTIECLLFLNDAMMDF